MRHLFSNIALLAVALTAISCSKDYIDSITPDELFNNSSKAVKVTNVSKGSKTEKVEASFPQVAVYRKSEKEGQSWFAGWSGGKMVDDCFFLSMYFSSVEKMKVGDALKISRFLFSFTYSSDSRASTEIYSGKITLADKGSNHVILHFNKVRCSCSFGDYLIDGYLYCPLYDEYLIDD